jgi:hypothetical protein
VDSLGPSDISDSGSDVVGGPGFAANLDDDQKLDLDTGTNSDDEASYAHDSAGSDIGDANLDSDSDFGGTGERAAAGRDLWSGMARTSIPTASNRSRICRLTDEDVDFLGSEPPRGK